MCVCIRKCFLIDSSMPITCYIEDVQHRLSRGWQLIWLRVEWGRMGATEALHAQSPALRPLGRWMRLYFALRTCFGHHCMAKAGRGPWWGPCRGQQDPSLAHELVDMKTMLLMQISCVSVHFLEGPIDASLALASNKLWKWFEITWTHFSRCSTLSEYIANSKYH